MKPRSPIADFSDRSSYIIIDLPSCVKDKNLYARAEAPGKGAEL